MNPRGEDRLGTTDGNVMIQLPNGFTKGTSVHTLGPDVNTTAELRWHKPYVSRYFPLKVLYFIVLLLVVLEATQRKEVFTQDNLLMAFASLLDYLQWVCFLLSSKPALFPLPRLL